MQRRFSPILLTALLVCGGLPIASSRQEPEPDPKQPDPPEPIKVPEIKMTQPRSPGMQYVGSKRRLEVPDHPLELLAALEAPYATIDRSFRVYQEPRVKPVKRPHAPRDRAAQRAAKKIKSAAKKRKGR